METLRGGKGEGDIESCYEEEDLSVHRLKLKTGEVIEIVGLDNTLEYIQNNPGEVENQVSPTPRLPKRRE